MGFAEQLNEILASLPTSRQTLLFSATLPKSLVEFAKAGLSDPTLVRLDVETKVSEDLEMAFFAIKDSEREAALLYILQEIIKMPTASEEQQKWLKEREKYGMEDLSDDSDEQDRKKKGKKGLKKRERLPRSDELPTPESTILFVPTKHHVEYISRMLILEGYAVSFIYGSLDQSARKEQLYRFRAGKTSIMVVTDVASRGIDIPVLANVINYNLPSSPKVFVHRVGRTARAGRRGWAYSLIKEGELAYLLDLEVFLGRKLLLSDVARSEVDYTKRLVLGSLPHDGMEVAAENVEVMLRRDYDLSSMQGVARRGEKLYNKSREIASQDSIKRAKELISEGGWDAQHLLLGPSQALERLTFLEKLANRRVKETVFEFKKTTYGSTAELMARRRQQLAPIQKRAAEKRVIKEHEKLAGLSHAGLQDIDEGELSLDADMVKATEDDINDAFGDQVVEDGSSKKRKHDRTSFRDPNFFISHYASAQDRAEEGYKLAGSTFAGAAQSATFDLVDEGKDFVQKQGMKWDKKKGKYVNAGSEDGVKYIRGENGQKIPASFRSGRFDAWKAAHKTSGPRVGTLESNEGRFQLTGKKFKHNKERAPKVMDKARDDYQSRKKRVQAAVDKGLKVKGFQFGQPASSLNSTSNILKQRLLKEKRREKNARPSKKSKR
jgi:ATP-dependent RNA helicase DDX54/DBP10